MLVISIVDASSMVPISPGAHTMICTAKKPVLDNEASYANIDDFAAIFTTNVDSLYGLAFLLTGNPQKAEKVFVGGLEDAVNDNKVFKEWAHSWAKRTVIQNAIREVDPHPTSSVVPIDLASAELPGPDAHFHLAAILALDDFERFVFVMSVLEHYSEYECALLLGSTRKQVRESRAHALKQLSSSMRLQGTVNTQLTPKHASMAA